MNFCEVNPLKENIFMWEGGGGGTKGEGALRRKYIYVGRLGGRRGGEGKGWGGGRRGGEGALSLNDQVLIIFFLFQFFPKNPKTEVGAMGKEF